MPIEFPVRTGPSTPRLERLGDHRRDRLSGPPGVLARRDTSRHPLAESENVAGARQSVRTVNRVRTHVESTRPTRGSKVSQTRVRATRPASRGIRGERDGQRPACWRRAAGHRQPAGQRHLPDQSHAAPRVPDAAAQGPAPLGGRIEWTVSGRLVGADVDATLEWPLSRAATASSARDHHGRTAATIATVR